MIDVNDLWPYELRQGNSQSPRDGACTMDAVSWFAYGRLGDRPYCACPVLTAYVIRGQDAMPHATRQLLKPFIFRLIGSRNKAAESKRVRSLVLAAVRVFVPIALDASGQHHVAARLRTLSDGASFAELAKAAGAAAAAAATAATAASAFAASAFAADAAAAKDAAAAAAAKDAASAAAAAAAAAGDKVWPAYIDALDAALKLGKQGDFDLDLVPTRLREFAEERERV
jgi:hypothetical protein